LIETFGFHVTASGYGVFGLAATVLIAWRWYAHVWRLDAPANNI